MVRSGGRNLHIIGGHMSGPFLGDAYDIEYCRRGGYTVFLDGVPYPIVEGDLYVIFPHVEARRSFTAPVTATSYITLDAGGEILKELGFSEENPIFPHKIPPQGAEAFEAIVDALDICGVYSVEREGHPWFDYLKNPREESPAVTVLRRNAAFFALAAELMQVRGETQKHSVQDDYVERALRFLNANFRREMKVGEIAEQIGIDRSYLFKLFREQVGVSLQQYLIGLRMDAAKTMLAETASAIGTVAASVGYEPLHFSKMFKRYFGVSPQEFRKRN
ncbi:MAG: helix-turn-helix transcriptional regulator [Oscillospiraceae bacterium]|nr:helix-turn-helix transcriptional regulator [Oscillospiraceae bacterium]